MPALDLLNEQLWGPVLGESVRVTTDGSDREGWDVVESYWMVPDAQRASLLLPRGPRAMTASAATNYRGMRRPWKSVGRGVIGAAARVGAPLGRDTLTVQVRADRPQAREQLLLHLLAEALGLPRVYAALGVRSGANRKATLSLLDPSGRPVGYAKVAWSETTAGFVRTEAAALREVGGREAAMRAPALLAEVDYAGHPVIVTEALPLDVRGSRDARVAPPTSAELYSLCPVHRVDRPGGTQQFSAMRSRLEALGSDPVAGQVVRRASRLADAVATSTVELPVTARWHGDLTPWNRARTSSGQLWVWDWESSEPDAVAGLDALHWSFSTRRPTSGRNEVVELTGCLADAGPHLRAAGVPEAGWPVVAALYALTVVERAADLAHRAGGWDRLWISREHLDELVEQGERLVLPGG